MSRKFVGLVVRTLILLHRVTVAANTLHVAERTTESEATSTAIAAPLAISPNGGWQGIDGNWSAFTVAIGTPEQNVSLLVSTASFQTWAVIPQGCLGASSYTNCSEERGGIFNETQSSSWQSVGTYGFSIEQNLGLVSNAYFAHDKVSLTTSDDTNLTVYDAIVGGTAGPAYYLGLFGINPKPTNFTSYNDPIPSYMTLLKESGSISSISWGYNAGASYRDPPIPASLTLGGYDANKLGSNNETFYFSADNSRELTIAIQQITTPSESATSLSPTALLPEPIYAYIDSTVAEIWLPTDACAAFELVFGLEYNDTYKMYLVNSTLHSQLIARNPSVTFTLAQGTDGGSTVSVTLPYDAFNPLASAPYNNLPADHYYFPIQRAANESQYTLGRTFLQEAYVIADYESQKLSISQAQMVADAGLQLVPVAQGTASTIYPGTAPLDGTKSLSSGAIAGIVVAVVIVLALAAAAAWFFWRRRRQARAALAEKRLSSDEDSVPRRGDQETVFPKAELEGSSAVDADKKNLLSAVPSTPQSATASTYFGTNFSSGEGTFSSLRSGHPFSDASEADSRERQIFEMPGDLPPVKEADGRQLTEKEAIDRRNLVYNGVDATPDTPDLPPFTPREPRALVDASDVVPARATGITQDHATEPASSGLRRAFSFEEASRSVEQEEMSRSPS